MNPIKLIPSAHVAAHCYWWPSTCLTEAVMALDSIDENEARDAPANKPVVKIEASTQADLHSDAEKEALCRHRDIKAWDSAAYQDAMKVKVNVWTGQSQ